MVLLAVRWAIDQQAGPAGDLFLPAFVRALGSLGLTMATGLPSYLAVGGVVGALAGLAVAEAIGISAERQPAPAQSSVERGTIPPILDRDMTGAGRASPERGIDP